MFNQISVNLNSVEFEYIEGGRLYCVSVGKPDGASVSQWSALWEGFKEFHESGKDLQTIVDEAIDPSELQELDDQIDDLREELDDRDSQIAKLEEEIAKLEDTVDELKEENRVLQNDLEAAERANVKLEEEIDDMHRQQAYGE